MQISGSHSLFPLTCTHPATTAHNALPFYAAALTAKQKIITPHALVKLP